MLRMAAWSVALLLSSCVTKVANAYAPESSRLPLTSLSPLSSRIILRIRLSDGKVVRLEASGDNTVQELLSKLEVMGHDVGGGLVIPPSKKFGKIDAWSQLESVLDPSRTIQNLNMSSGDWLSVIAHSREGNIRVKAATGEKLKRLKNNVEVDKKRRSWQPFPKYARLPPAQWTGHRQKTLRDLEEAAAQVQRIIPQKNGRVVEASVSDSAVENFARHVRADFLKNKRPPTRCALLFGAISEKENGMKKPSYCIRVEAIFEPPRVSKKENGVCRDLYGVEDLVKGSHLEEAKRISTRLGLQHVGWCFSHLKRGHFLAAEDVNAAAELQVMAMKVELCDAASLDNSGGEAKGRESYGGFLTLAFPVDAESGEVSTEAFSLSDQAVQMWYEGVFLPTNGHENPKSNIIHTQEPVCDGHDTNCVDTLGLVSNVAIRQHEGLYHPFVFPSNVNKHTLLQCLRKKCTKLSNHLLDLQLLTFISCDLGLSREVRELCDRLRQGQCVDKYVERLTLLLDSLN